MTLDGMPLNEPEDQGVYFSNYPDFLSSVNSMQIQRGVGITNNGVASYAGSINFESPSLTKDTSMSVSLGYGSYNSSRFLAELKSGKRGKMAYYFRTSHLYSDGYKEHSSNTSKSAFFGAGYFGNKNIFKLNGFVGNQKNQLAWIGIPRAIINERPKTNGNSDENDNFTQALVKLLHIFAINNQSEISSSVYYNFLDGNYDFDLNNFLSQPLTDEMYNYDFKHHFMGAFSNYSLRLNGLKLNTGVHANSFQRTHLGSERSLGELYENTGYKKEFSAFVKVNYCLNQFEFLASAQYRHSNFDYEGTVPLNKMNWDFVNYQFGLNYKLGGESVLYYSFGNTSREPTRNDLFYGEDNLSNDNQGNAILANIKWENVADHEFGLRYQSNKVRLNANIYYMSFKNEIVLNGQFGPNGLALHSNVANSFRSGGEVDIYFQLNKTISFENSSSYSHNQISENSINFKPILSPELIVNQSIIYKYSNLLIKITGRYQSESYLDFANDFELPDYHSVAMQLNYKLGQFELSLRTNNITSAKILSNGYIGLNGEPLYFIQAPANFYAAITWTL